MRHFFKSLFRVGTYVGGIFSIIDWVVGLLSGIFSFLGRPLSRLIMKVPGISSLPKFGELFTQDYDHVEKLREMYKDSDEPLLNGDIEQAAREAFPPEDYPEMWCEWRSDANPGIIFDGKLVNGEEVKDLSYNYATKESVNESFERARRTALEYFVSALAGLYFAAFVTVFYEFSFSPSIEGFLDAFNGEAIARGEGLGITEFFAALGISIDFTNPFMGAAPTSDVWGSASVPLFHNLMAGLGVLVSTILNPFLIIAALISAKIRLNLEGTKRLRKIIEKGGEAYRKQTKESVVGWINNAYKRKEYLHKLGEARKKNEEYIKKVGFDGGIRVGRSTGYFMAHGMHQSNSVLPDKDVILDGEAQTKNVLVIGETGGGKTTDAGIPFVMQLAKQDKRGFFVMDSKGVLWMQIINNLKKHCPEKADRYIVIGTGQNNGQDNYGVDVLEGMDPSQVSDQFFSISNSMSVGGAGNDYFPQEAANVVENAARILHAYELTEAGMADWDDSNTRPYSILSILKFGTDENYRLKVCAEILASLSAERANAGNDYAKAGARILVSCDQEALLNNIYWMSYKGDGTMNGDTFPKMHEGQRSGVIGSFKKMLNFVYRHKEMRNRFCRGRRSRDWEDQNLIDIQDVFDGYLVCINLNIEELGLVGLAVARLLKQRLYNMASRRQPMLEAKGIKPQIECPVTLVIDEAQNFISATKDAGMDEGNAPNVLRSSGLSMIFLTQGYSALKKTIGEDNLNNFLNNFTNKIFFRNSDKETGEEVSRLVGQGYRLHAHHEGENENWLQVQAMYKTLSPSEFLKKYRESKKFMDKVESMQVSENKYDLMPPITVDKIYQAPDAIRSLAHAGGGASAGKALTNMAFGMPQGGGNGDAAISRELDFEKHQENMERRSRETGNQSEQIVDPGFMATMKDHEAIVIFGQAGYVRMDLVELDNSMY